MAVVDSYLENFHDSHSDSQAIGGWNGPGPFKIVNNFLEAASENIMFGGADPAIELLVPADIEIRRNLSTKRLSWKAPASRRRMRSSSRTRGAARGRQHLRARLDVRPERHRHRAEVGEPGGRCTWCVTEYVTFATTSSATRRAGWRSTPRKWAGRAAAAPRRKSHPDPERAVREHRRRTGDRRQAVARHQRRVRRGDTHVTSMSNPNGILDPRSPPT